MKAAVYYENGGPDVFRYEDVADVIDMIEAHIRDVAAGALRVEIDRTFPLSEATAAHAYIESRQAFGRVLLIP